MRHVTLAFVTLALLESGWVMAQDPADVLNSQVDVEVVNIDVTVADRDGRPVRNLTEDDFRLTVDGKKVGIQFFDPPAEDASGRESVVVLVDNRHLVPDSRNEALAALEAPLLRLARAGVQIQVVAFAGVLQVIEPFTTDETRIRIGLVRARHAGNEASQRMWESRQVAVDYVVNQMQSLPRTPPQELIEQTAIAVASQLQGFAEFESQDGKELLDSMQLMVAALGGLPGHKTVLLLSDGFALQPADKVFDRLAGAGRRLSQTDPTAQRSPEGGLASTDPTAGVSPQDTRFSPREGFASPVLPGGAEKWRRGYDELSLVADVQVLTQVANTGGVTVHTLPLTPTFLDEVERNQQVDLGQDLFVVSDLDYGLEMLARETGGRAHNRTDELTDFLERAAPEIAASYSLGFTPAEADAAYHEIKVKVKGKGLEVRHRPGYVSRSVDERVAARTIAAVVLDLVENPHGLGIAVEGMTPLENGLYRVQLVTHVPIANIDLAFDGESYFADLRFAATYLDAAGRLGDLQQAEAPLRIPAADLDAAREQKHAALLALAMPAGSQAMAIGVWNHTTGRGSFVAGNIDVQPPPAEP